MIGQIRQLYAQDYLPGCRQTATESLPTSSIAIGFEIARGVPLRHADGSSAAECAFRNQVGICVCGATLTGSVVSKVRHWWGTETSLAVFQPECIVAR